MTSDIGVCDSVACYMDPVVELLLIGILCASDDEMIFVR